jgi:hypothetical protein
MWVRIKRMIRKSEKLFKRVHRRLLSKMVAFFKVLGVFERGRKLGSGLSLEGRGRGKEKIVEGSVAFHLMGKSFRINRNNFILKLKNN